jgi:hypothetical protein
VGFPHRRGLPADAPSTLAFAYPNENPNVNRAGAAAPVVMLLAALPAGYLLRLFAGRHRACRARPGPPPSR